MYTGTQKIVIERGSPQELIDKAYTAMFDTYKKLVLRYCHNTCTAIYSLIVKVGCRNRKEIHDFLNGRDSRPAGIDLERVLTYGALEERFVDEVPVEISREVINPQPAINASPIEIEVRNEIERRLRVLNWFYLMTTERALQQRSLIENCQKSP